jgi:FAD/FMN-containing dehydrogenase
LNKIEYKPEFQTLLVGSGCLFDEIYAELKPLERNIVGGSATAGVGIGGYLTGGGYSMKTNQFGLGIDNIQSVNIVLPDGEIKKGVSETNDSDLFWAVKVRLRDRYPCIYILLIFA